MSYPLVSIIIPTYNRPYYLREAISSVVNQTYKNIEIIVVDDGSKINYAESICAEFENCTYFYKINGGLSSARNYGIINSKGNYIAFLDDDDFWREDKLQKQVEVLAMKSSIDLVHSSALVVDEQSNSLGRYIGAASNKIHRRSGYVFWNALGTWVVKSPTPLIRKSVFKSDLMFDESIKVGEDVDFYQRLFYRHKVHYINEPLAYYREYNCSNRLSNQVVQYIGIEKKTYNNFFKMGIRNPFILYRISYALLNSALNRQKLNLADNNIKINWLTKLIFPLKILNKI